MRTTLNLPTHIIQEAMDLTKTKTKTSVIVMALENLIRKSKLAGIKKYKGKVDMGIDLSILRRR